MFRRLALGNCVVLHLRFDSLSEKSTCESVCYKRLPESMQPKSLEKNFTPFPLPKYDEDLGYGPVRLRNIPDIERAKERPQEKVVALMEFVSTHSEEKDEICAHVLEEKNAENFKKEAADLDSTSLLDNSSSLNLIRATGRPDYDEDGDALKGYFVCSEYPLIDRLQCNRSLQDLLSQFAQRPEVEARCAALADMASTILMRSNAELIDMFKEISSPFSPNGRGLNFLVTNVLKFGRPYNVTNALVTAYVKLVDAATVALVQEQPWRLASSPALVIQLLHFMALIKVFEPNKWFTSSDHAPSNRADYKHPRGVNNNTAFWCTGHALFDFMLGLLQKENEHSEYSPFLLLCTNEELVDLLNGFSAVMPDGKPIGNVFNLIMEVFLQRVKSRQGVSWTPQDFVTVERMYFTSVMADSRSEILLQFLLSDTSCLRGPDFFGALSRTREIAIHEKALVLLQNAIDVASANGDEVNLLALLESGSEMLFSMSDKDMAYEFAMRNQFDYRILRSFQHFACVADRLCAEQPRISNRIPHLLCDVQAQLLSRNSTKALVAGTNTTAFASVSEYIIFNPDGRFASPLKTLLSQLEYLNDMDSVFLLHSSLITRSTDQLVSAVRRLLSGKDSLIVSMSCIRELSVRSVTSPHAKEREICGQALEIIAYEMEVGRVVLVPFSEEIRLHDAGAYCDEDLILWTIAAFFARELPLVKVHTLIHSNSIARTPYRFLKGGHNLLVSSNCLYDKDAPLLSALHSKELKLVTRNVKLRTPVRDRKCTLHYYNPVRARFVYRRDKAMFDKYHTNLRNLAPGFSRGALRHDWRGLGVYTPDYPQVSYRPLPPLRS